VLRGGIATTRGIIHHIFPLIQGQKYHFLNPNCPKTEIIQAKITL